MACIMLKNRSLIHYCTQTKDPLVSAVLSIHALLSIFPSQQMTICLKA